MINRNRSCYCFINKYIWYYYTFGGYFKSISNWFISLFFIIIFIVYRKIEKIKNLFSLTGLVIEWDKFMTFCHDVNGGVKWNKSCISQECSISWEIATLIKYHAFLMILEFQLQYCHATSNIFNENNHLSKVLFLAFFC